MTNPLITTLQQTRKQGRMALCGYFLVGYPTPDEFFRSVRASVDLDVIEFGIPADEPRMDGPVIASAHQVVTGQRGIHAEPALALIGGLRTLPQPRLVMTYAAVGRSLDGFLKLCVENEIDGMIAPDIDPVEGAQVAQKARALGLAFITLLDARASDEAVRWSVENGDLVYIKASTSMTTGQSADIGGELRSILADIIGRVRAIKPSVPVGVGIGLQRPEQVAELASLDVDMAIVGTKIVEHVQTGENSLVKYIRSLREATAYT
ncbi:MAG: tryptophan synthase subunit alpha [Chloroflexota bacterium]